MFASSPLGNSRSMAAAYGMLSFPLFLVGLSIIVMSALASRAAAFRFMCTTNTFTYLSHIGICFYYFAPMVNIFYFLSTQHTLYVNYYMMIYYFTGSFSFASVFFVFFGMSFDRPIQAFLNLKKDIRDAHHSKFYRLADYLPNFREEDGVNLMQTVPKEEEAFLAPDLRQTDGLFNNLKGKREDSQAGNIKVQRDTRLTGFSSDRDFTGADQRDTS